MRAGRIAVEMPSQPENAGLARLVVAAVAARLGFTVTEIEEIKVAVSEAVTNAIVHGYGDRDDGVIRLEVAVERGVLEVCVIDRGRGIPDVDLARQPAFSTDPERMGLGFAFMENFMDEVMVTTGTGTGTRVTMRKRAGAPACAPSGS